MKKKTAVKLLACLLTVIMVAGIVPLHALASFYRPIVGSDSPRIGTFGDSVVVDRVIMPHLQNNHIISISVPGEIDLAVRAQSVDYVGNQTNMSGTYTFGAQHVLAGYSLVFDIRNNGANIVTFELRPIE